MNTIDIPPGLKVDIRSNLLPGRPAVVLSSGYGIFGFREPVQLALIELLEQSGIGWVQYTYAERNEKNQTTDLLISTAAAALKAVISWSIDHGAREIALFGISFGATVSLEVALHSGTPLLLLINPVVDYVQYRTRQLGEEKIAEWRDRSVLTLTYGDRPAKSYYRFMEEAASQDLLGRLGGLNSRLIICQAEQDSILGVSYAQQIGRICQDSQVHIIADADHVFASPDAIGQFIDAIRNTVREWADSYDYGIT